MAERIYLAHEVLANLAERRKDREVGIPIESPLGRKILGMVDGGSAATSGQLYVWVSVPPSTNHLFVSRGKRRCKSRAYKAWLKEAVPVMAGMARPTVPAQVTIALYGGDGLNESRDLDNIAKPILDAIVAAGVLPDDSLRHVRRVAMEYLPDDPLGNGPAVLVGVRPLEVLG